MPQMLTFIWFGNLSKLATTHLSVNALKNKPKNMIMAGYVDGAVIKGCI